MKKIGYQGVIKKKDSSPTERLKMLTTALFPATCCKIALFE
jgi:hypothetical protein